MLLQHIPMDQEYLISLLRLKSEMLFLMGPTGSGKSTLLKAIYKGISIDSGVVC